jgi:hypothetical protein
VSAVESSLVRSDIWGCRSVSAGQDNLPLLPSGKNEVNDVEVPTLEFFPGPDLSMWARWLERIEDE